MPSGGLQNFKGKRHILTPEDVRKSMLSRSKKAKERADKFSSFVYKRLKSKLPQSVLDSIRAENPESDAETFLDAVIDALVYSVVNDHNTKAAEILADFSTLTQSSVKTRIETDKILSEISQANNELSNSFTPPSLPAISEQAQKMGLFSNG